MGYEFRETHYWINGRRRQKMNFKRFLSLMVFIPGLVLVTHVASPLASPSFSTHWISIVGNMEGEKLVTRLEPSNEVYAGIDTRVIWVNNSTTDVKIKFGQGSKCKEVTSGAFKVMSRGHVKNCYVTRDSIPPGGTLMLRFDQQGNYNYGLIFVGSDQELHGVIHVSNVHR
jgi:hypothetical protein